MASIASVPDDEAGMGVTCMAAVFIAADASPAAASQATFRASTHVISVNVSVKRGEKFAQGLPASDFVLQDNGIVQAVELVSTEIVGVLPDSGV